MTFMPRFIQPVEETTNEQQMKLEAELLDKLSRQRFSQLLTECVLAAPESTYIERLDSELQILEKKKACGYFLIVADYVNWAKDNEIAVGPGRGSGPCSLVGFVLGITNVDPIKYDLPFERFVNPLKETIPDFDLDFCSERCGEVTSYLQSKYGKDRVAQLSSVDTTPLPSRLVICDRPLTKLVSLYSNPDSGFPTANVTLAQVADAGLVQFNVIDQKALTAIQHTIENISNSGVQVDINSIDPDDASTFRLLCSGELSDFKDLEINHCKAALIEIQPQRFEDLYATIALSYPGLRSQIPLYTQRKRNPELIQYIHPTLTKITADTYGLILYQEQVMHIAHEIAGLSFAESDLFRRALKKAVPETVTKYKNLFIDGAVNSGVSNTEAKDIYEQVAASNQTCFNKSHAIAFALIAYQSAWLKANFQQHQTG